MKGKVKIEHLGTNPSAFAGGRPVRAADTSSITRLVVQDRDAIVKCGRRRFFDKSPREREKERASSIVCQDFEGCVRWHGLVLFPHVFLQHPGTVLQLGCSK